MGRFDEKVALVTGGSSGIGRATAIAFALEGAKVVIAARREKSGIDTVAEIERLGGKALFVATDVARPDDVTNLVVQTVKHFGRLDYAVNNAARIDETSALTADVAEQDFDKTVGVNLKGVWLCMRSEIRQMLTQEPRGGAIVNTSSINGLGGCPQASTYAATKAAVIALSKSAAWEYVKQGIRINSLVAGPFRTPMLEVVMDRAAGASGDNPEARRAVEAGWSAMTAAGRIGDPAEAAAAVLWLCSNDSSYVVGHSMIVDGGLTALWR